MGYRQLIFCIFCSLQLISTTSAQQPSSITTKSFPFTKFSKDHPHPKMLMGTMDYKTTYGNKITPSFYGDPNMVHTTWIIYNDKNKKVKQGRGTSFVDFDFKRPGNYKITFTLDPAIFDRELAKNGCFHPSIPAELDITIQDYKIEYLFEEMTLKHPLISNKDHSDNILSIPVMVHTYDGKPHTFRNLTLRTAGVQAQVTGALLDEEVTLSPGRHVLKYYLSGTVMKDSYIMFDFWVDHNDIQAFGYLERIQ